MGTIMSLHKVRIGHSDAFELRADDGFHVTVASRLAAVQLAATFQWKLKSVLNSLDRDATTLEYGGNSPPRGERN
jgi:hypothetical protein